MFQFSEYLLDGVVLGLSYGLLAFPISLLFVATDTVDLTVGGYAVLAGMVAALLSGPVGILIGILCAAAAAAAVGVISSGIRRSRNDDPLPVVLGTFGTVVILESLILLIFGKDPVIRQPFTVFWNVSGIRISPQAVINLAVVVGLWGALSLLLYKTSWGRSMRASAFNRLGAELAGIAVRRLRLVTYVLAGAIAGVAGVLILYTSGVEYSSGLRLTLSGFGAAIVFGLQGPLRGLFGAVAIGVVESVSTGYATSATATVIPLLFIMTMLLTGRMSKQQVVGGRA
jgi:branched-chain amino acid transport system permease protein